MAKRRDAYVKDAQSSSVDQVARGMGTRALSGVRAFNDPAPATAYAETLYRINIPTTYATDGVDKSTDFTIGITKSGFASPPVPAPVVDPYYTISYYVGFNFAANGTPEVASQTAFGLWFEQYYYQESVYADEFQFRHYTYEGTQCRPLQGFMPRHDADGALRTIQMSVGRCRWYDYDDTPVVLWDIHNKNLDFLLSTKQRFDVNNVPIAQQKNSGGVLTNLPFLNARNEYEITSLPVYHNTDPKTNANGNSSFRYQNWTNAAASGYGVMTFAGNVTGTFFRDYWSQNVSVNLTTQETNTHATGGLRHEYTTTGGDITWTTARGANFWIWGHKASDDSLHFSPGGTLGVNDALVLLQSKSVQVGGSLKVASYTVATVPSAATEGAGAMIYVSNEAGGAVIAFSDGTDWRRLTDRAIIS